MKTNSEYNRFESLFSNQNRIKSIVSVINVSNFMHCFDAVNDALDRRILCVCSSQLRINCPFPETK